MKVLLINPLIENIIKNVPDSIVKIRDVGYPNLGIMYIASYLVNVSNEEVKILDTQIEGLSYKDIENEIKRRKPDVVGIPATSFTLIDAVLTAKTVKNIDRDIKIVFGGRHPTIYPKETAKLNEVDFVVVGEGEQTFAELVKNINNKSKLKKIKGLAFKENGSIIFTGIKEPMIDLDKIPFPARYMTPYKKYRYALSKNKIFTTMITSRGCPYNCLFCDKSLGNIFRVRSARNVVDEMEECINMGIKEIILVDDTFSIDKKRVFKICDEIIDRKLNVDLTVRTRVNLVDEDIIKKLKRSGCQRIHYGVESGSQRILNIIRKEITLNQVRKAISLAKKYDLDVLCDFMIGSPGESLKEILDTVNFVIKIDVDYVLFNVTTPYPNTDLYRMGIEKGLFNDFWLEFARNPTEDFKTKLWTESLSEKELSILIKYAYKQFYQRPLYILQRALKITSLSELKEKIKTGLKVFSM